MLLHWSQLILMLFLSFPVPHHVADKSEEERPECPDHQFIPRDKDGIPLGPVIIPLVGPATNIPEFNDCQALIHQDRYGPIVAIFATQHEFPVPDISRWYLVAVIYNFGTLSKTDVAYQPLSLGTRFTCLYAPITGAVKNAHVTWRQNEHCDSAIAAPSEPNLFARIRPVNTKVDSIPRVARWEWDAVNKQQYIGVQCGRRRWCEIAESKKTEFAKDPSTGWVATVPGGIPVSAVHRVRGYFDEQELAVPLAGGDPKNPLKPSGMRGIFFPAPDLASLSEIGVTAYAGWRYVGTMMVDKTHPKYRAMFGLKANTPTHVFLRKKFADAGGNPVSLVDGKEPYEAEFRSDTIVTRNYWRRSHPELQLPGTVRWRWLWNDETTWVQCLQGCCSTQ